MYKYKLNEETSKVSKFQEERINAFSEIENELEALIKPLRQAKISTIKYYRENPNSFSVVTGTDLIKDYLKDIKTLLTTEE
jgi:hypothetical protein